MITVFKLLLLFFTIQQSMACEIKRPLISLSGPITMLLEELDLLKSKKLIAISTLHPIRKKFTGRLLGGGVFLSRKVLKHYSETDFIFDKSNELSNLFKNSGVKSYKELDLTGKDAFQSYKMSLKFLTPYLESCEKRVLSLERRVEKIRNNIKTKNIPNMIFFLGEIKSKLPELIMVNDGFVKTLMEKKEFKTYPSELAYVSWSQRVLFNLDNFLLVGVGDQKKNEIIKLGENKVNVFYRGVLTPGVRQIYFLDWFLNELN